MKKLEKKLAERDSEIEQLQEQVQSLQQQLEALSEQQKQPASRDAGGGMSLWWF